MRECSVPRRTTMGFVHRNHPISIGVYITIESLVEMIGESPVQEVFITTPIYPIMLAVMTAFSGRFQYFSKVFNCLKKWKGSFDQR